MFLGNLIFPDDDAYPACLQSLIDDLSATYTVVVTMTPPTESVCEGLGDPCSTLYLVWFSESNCNDCLDGSMSPCSCATTYLCCEGSTATPVLLNDYCVYDDSYSVLGTEGEGEPSDPGYGGFSLEV